MRVAEVALSRAASRTKRSAFDFPRAWRRSYASGPTPLSRETRLLGLVQMWSAMGALYVYPEYSAPEWRSPSLPIAWLQRAETAETPREFHRALQRMLALTNDSHVRLTHSSLAPELHSVPIFAERFGARVIVTRVDASATTRLTVGTELLEIDGVRVSALEDTFAPFIPSTNRAMLARDVWRNSYPMRGPKDSDVRLSVRDRAGVRTVTLRRTLALDGIWMRREADSLASQPVVTRLPGNIGYVDLYRLHTGAGLDSALAQLADASGLILDVRSGAVRWEDGDPRDQLAARFLNAPIAYRSQAANVQYTLDGPPVSAVEHQTWSRVPWKPELVGTRWTKPFAVLIGPRDQSGAEATVAPFRDARRALFVGQPTAGTNGEAPDIRIVSGALLIFTHSRQAFADGSRYQGVGIIPDVSVTPTPGDIRRGVDVAKEAARQALVCGCHRNGKAPPSPK